MNRLATLLQAGAVLCIPAGIACQNLPEDWPQRDLEGKWAYYHQDRKNSQDPDCAKNWASLLGEEREFELLEWIALYEGWMHPGPQLVKYRAPQMYRAALWNLGAWDSHNKDTARDALLAEGGHALGWIEQSPLARRGHGSSLTKMLRDRGYQPDDPGEQLPPHDPMQMLVPMLDAPTELPWFGDRLRAEPRQRYVDQVLRALAGFAVLGQDEPMIVAKVVTLMGHPQAEVSVAATEAITKVPATSVPWKKLLALATDAEEDDLRRKATTALSHSHHPAAFFALYEIGEDNEHPGNSLALLRLGDLGDAYTLEMLRELSAAQPDRSSLKKQVSRLEQNLRLHPELTQHDARKLLDRIVWLRLTESPRAAAAAAAIKQQLEKAQPVTLREPFAGAQPPTNLEGLLEQALDLPPQPGLQGADVDRLRRAFVAEVLPEGSGN